MGTCCTKDESSSRRAQIYVHTPSSSTVVAVESEYDKNRHSMKHMTKEEETVSSSSLPPSPPRGNNVKFVATVQPSGFAAVDLARNQQQQQQQQQQQSPTKRHRQISVEATNTSPENINNNNNNKNKNNHRQHSAFGFEQQQQQQREQDEEEEERPSATAHFLRHVNGSSSHPVARVIFEQWCIILNSIEKEDEALLFGRNVGGGGDGVNNNNNMNMNMNMNMNINHGDKNVVTDDADDGFGNVHSSNPIKDGGGAVGKAIFFHPKMFGEGVDVAHSAAHTRIAKWATLHASEAVTHESVEEVVQDFLPSLREEMERRGWGGDFEYNQEGYDNTGTVRVTIKLVRYEGEEMPHTYEIVVNYHAISLL